MTAMVKAYVLDDEQVGLIKRTICPDATDDELKLFVATSQRLGLDPFARQIFAVHRWSKRAGLKFMSIQVSIDGFRLTAERTKEYEGQIGPQWCSGDDVANVVWRDVWVSKSAPFAARIGVWRKGFREPIYAVARFEAYQQTVKGGGLNEMWRKMGDLMIAKCAEALALRRAFPADLSGVYSPDEMGQADNVIEVVAVKREDEPKHQVVDLELAPPAKPEIPDAKKVALDAIKALLTKYCWNEDKKVSTQQKKENLSAVFDTSVWKRVEELDAATLHDGLGKLQDKFLDVGKLPEWMDPAMTADEIEEASKVIA